MFANLDNESKKFFLENFGISSERDIEKAKKIEEKWDINFTPPYIYYGNNPSYFEEKYGKPSEKKADYILIDRVSKSNMYPEILGRLSRDGKVIIRENTNNKSDQNFLNIYYKIQDPNKQRKILSIKEWIKEWESMGLIIDNIDDSVNILRTFTATMSINPWFRDKVSDPILYFKDNFIKTDEITSRYIPKEYQVKDSNEVFLSKWDPEYQKYDKIVSLVPSPLELKGYNISNINHLWIYEKKVILDIDDLPELVEKYDQLSIVAPRYLDRLIQYLINISNSTVFVISDRITKENYYNSELVSLHYYFPIRNSKESQIVFMTPEKFKNMMLKIWYQTKTIRFCKYIILDKSDSGDAQIRHIFDILLYSRRYFLFKPKLIFLSEYSLDKIYEIPEIKIPSKVRVEYIEDINSIIGEKDSGMWIYFVSTFKIKTVADSLDSKKLTIVTIYPGEIFNDKIKSDKQIIVITSQYVDKTFSKVFDSMREDSYRFGNMMEKLSETNSSKSTCEYRKNHTENGICYRLGKEEDYLSLSDLSQNQIPTRIPYREALENLYIGKNIEEERTIDFLKKNNLIHSDNLKLSRSGQDVVKLNHLSIHAARLLSYLVNKNGFTAICLISLMDKGDNVFIKHLKPQNSNLAYLLENFEDFLNTNCYRRGKIFSIKNNRSDIFNMKGCQKVIDSINDSLKVYYKIDAFNINPSLVDYVDKIILSFYPNRLFRKDGKNFVLGSDTIKLDSIGNTSPDSGIALIIERGNIVKLYQNFNPNQQRVNVITTETTIVPITEEGGIGEFQSDEI